MFKFFTSFRKPKIKKIAFIDGDQSLNLALNAYSKYIAGSGTETHFIMAGSFVNKPKRLVNLPEINDIYLTGFCTGKEITDKYIASFINKSINEGYNHITVISADYDFIDIFKLAVILDKRAAELTFRIILPKPQGKCKDLPDQIANIEIIKT